MKYVALLRGINVGGKNKLPMKDLAAMFAATGCKDVRTYIQSGNVVFSASPVVVKKVANAVTQAIEKKFGYKIPVVIRSAEEIAKAVRENPFAKKAADVKLLFVSFLIHEPDSEAIAALDAARSAPDAFLVIGREIYLHIPTGAAKTKLTNAYFDSRLKTISTVRNWNTVLALLELISD